MEKPTNGELKILLDGHIASSTEKHQEMNKKLDIIIEKVNYTNGTVKWHDFIIKAGYVILPIACGGLYLLFRYQTADIAQKIIDSSYQSQRDSISSFIDDRFRSWERKYGIEVEQ